MKQTAHMQTMDQLIERYQEPLYWYVRRMVVSHEDAQDVLQETFIQIFNAIDTLRKSESEKAWVYRVATNEALQWLRRKHEFVSLDSDDASVLLETLKSETYIDNTDYLQVLFQEAILTLPTMQRAVFNLRYYEELAYEDIALITKSTIGAVKTNYHIAKQKISNYILLRQ